ncbi:hypothetical protein [Spirosoma fluviale]|nr:hypothetical protein [Spirosoma fluviale]
MKMTVYPNKNGHTPPEILDVMQKVAEALQPSTLPTRARQPTKKPKRAK